MDKLANANCVNLSGTSPVFACRCVEMLRTKMGATTPITPDSNQTKLLEWKVQHKEVFQYYIEFNFTTAKAHPAFHEKC